ncbi:molybdopterin molybdotransferase [Endobacter medicaginis]|uniref:Molybdopterin molybdenumtransferase n=1 Tax=Endobacter medicaginis TaxID=1181271 RepID=A0A839UWK3_9PROT|nr:gephyrin-like molybdotransferase Glp [Endobacter medicaginis]MBB3172754.1 molybdopterin molybdotransferase [Endobacter medicaginis]MCX5474361.1 molybdopterin molybdotransferase MoeA [Endobacter medicaginis]NVN29373.1 molybdopterin molybdotransferase MoeA [Endobacter medicaginis]
MISVEEARTRILAPLVPVGTETVALGEAWGRVLAREVVARLDNPPADVSAMDGYAVRSADTRAGTALRLIGSAPAGHPFGGEVGRGECVRIFTGAVVPNGADSILIQEDATREGEAVIASCEAPTGRHIRRRGQDFDRASVLLAPGRRLGARDIGVAAAANHPFLTVRRRPRIALLATGDEIALPGEPIGPGGIVSSNSLMLAALIRAAGGEPVLLPLATDDNDAIGATARAAAGMDMLLTIGGASVGEHDLVRTALAAEGLTLDFWKIAMRPGKPLMHGRLGSGQPVLGLPGNPVSAMVCSVLFLLPALARLSGTGDEGPTPVEAVLEEGVGANDHRADHLRARLSVGRDGTLLVRAFPRQDSAMLRRLAEAEALILRPPGAAALPAGATVQILRLDGYGL